MNTNIQGVIYAPCMTPQYNTIEITKMTQRTNYETPETTRLFLAFVGNELSKYGLNKYAFDYSSISIEWAENIQLKNFVETLDDFECIKIVNFGKGKHIFVIIIKDAESIGEYSIEAIDDNADTISIADSINRNWQYLDESANYELADR